MSFATTLKAYCDELDCTSKAIAEASGISPSALSRYLRGGRTPSQGSPIVANLANALASLSRESRDAEPLQADEVHAALEAELKGSYMVGMDFGSRLDALMRLSSMRNTDAVKVLSVDPSYISRIRRGQRSPANMKAFAMTISHLTAHYCIIYDKLDELGELIESPDLASRYHDISPFDESDVAEAIAIWLLGSHIVQSDLAKLDDLYKWIDATDFTHWLALNHAPHNGEPSQPDAFARFYYKIEGMQEAEISFLRTAIDTGAREIFLSNDMPLLYLEPSPKYLKEFGGCVNELIEHGCLINVTFNLDRSISDIARSLRNWIPLYLTGLVKPYYLPGLNNRLFFHANYVCETCALASEAVQGHHGEGRYYFSTLPEDVSYYRQKMGFILEKASSLLEFYRECDPDQKRAFEKTEAARQAKSTGRVMSEGRFQNLRIVNYPGDCTVITLPGEPTTVHAVIRHPKINYIVSHMR